MLHYMQAAFMIGWDIILEYVIGVSSTASALSNYIDSLFSFNISAYLRAHFSFSSVAGFSTYPNLLACLFVLMVTGLLVLGAKESSQINNLTCLLNLTILTLIMIVGMYGADFNNWHIDPKVIYTSLSLLFLFYSTIR